MKKVNAKIDNNGYVECGYCGCSTVEYDENGKVKLSNNFVTTKDGFGLNFPSVRSVYSEELKRELTELTINFILVKQLKKEVFMGDTVSVG